MNGTFRKTLGLTIGLALSTFAASAAADPMPARETARVLPKSGIAVGLMSPSAYGLGHGLEVTTMVIPWLLISPNLSVRAQLLEKKGLVFSAEYGLAVPSGAMRLTQGYLFPSYAVTNIKPGFLLQQHAGFWLSGGSKGTWTARIDVTGVFANDPNFGPLNSYAPFNLWFGPATGEPRWHLGGTYDHPLTDWLRGRVGLNGYLMGSSTSDLSPFYVSAEAGLEARLGKRMRLAIGGVWYNYDTHDVEQQADDTGRTQNVHVRTNDIYPTFDLVFYSP